MERVQGLPSSADKWVFSCTEKKMGKGQYLSDTRMGIPWSSQELKSQKAEVKMTHNLLDRDLSVLETSSTAWQAHQDCLTTGTDFLFVVGKPVRSLMTEGQTMALLCGYCTNTK